MGAGPVATERTTLAYSHLVDPNRKWYNNRRYAFLQLEMISILLPSS
jgi:hypothetical protein